MEVNVGGLDRILRIVVGVFIVSLAFWGPQTMWAWLGFILVATGVAGQCPIYAVLGINTCRLTPS